METTEFISDIRDLAGSFLHLQLLSPTLSVRRAVRKHFPV